MTPLDPTLGPDFRPRDRLAAEDLTEWERVPLFALARHFRQFHGRYGVASGLTVEVRPAGGGWEVAVAAGVAYDPLGRPLVVGTATAVAVPGGGRPPRGGVTHVLVLRGSAPDPGPLGVPVPVPRTAVARFVAVGEPGAPWDVPLAGLRWPADAGVPRADPAYRATAGREFRRPYVAGGTLPAGATAVRLVRGAKTIGWQVWVDTRGAGFLQSAAPPGEPAEAAGRRPVYLVAVGRQTADDAVRLLTGVTALSAPGPKVLGSAVGRRGPVTYVSRASADGFLLTVRYRREQAGLDGLEATPLLVSWVGVEMDPAAPDRPDGDGGGDVRPEGDIVGPSTEQLSFRWPEFRDGRVLSAEALNELQTTLRNLLQLHNRTLHDWGVAQGCGVTPLEAGRGVRVGPGYAVDSDGRELLVPAAVELAVPAGVARPGSSARTWWVTASYREGPAPREDDPGCRMEGVPLRRLPEAVVRWRDPEADAPGDRLRPGLDVILASVTIDRGAVAGVTGSGRRSAVPSPRPHVHAGRHEITADAAARLRSSGGPWEVRVDTRAGGFVDTPHYLVTVEADGADASELDLNRLPHQAVVVDPTNEGFTVVLPAGATPTAGAVPVPAVGAAVGSAGRAVVSVLAWVVLVALILALALLGALGVGQLARLDLARGGDWQRVAGGVGTVVLFVVVWYLASRYFERRERDQPLSWLRAPQGASWRTWGGRLAAFLLVLGGTVAVNTLDQLWPGGWQQLRGLQNDTMATLRQWVADGSLAGRSGPEWLTLLFGADGDRLLSTVAASVVGLLPLLRRVVGWFASKLASGARTVAGWPGAIRRWVREQVGRWREGGGTTAKRAAGGPRGGGRAAPRKLIIAWVGIEV